MGIIISEWLKKASYHFTLGYSGYYILGYYLYRYKLPVKVEIPLYILGACTLAATGLANLTVSIAAGEEIVQFTQYLRPNVVIVTMAVYTFGVKRLSRITFSKKAEKRIATLSECSFGVYLVHALVLEFCAQLGLTPTLIHPLLMIPIYTVIVYLTSHLIIRLVRKIPVVGRKITSNSKIIDV